MSSRNSVHKKGNINNTICPYCGEPIIIGQRTHKAHIIPCALYKWIRIPEELVEKIDTGGLNVFRAHERCDAIASSKILSIDDIFKLHLSDDEVFAIASLRGELNTYIKQYEHLQNKVLYKQDFRCCRCGKHITSGVIRRIKKPGYRRFDNARIECELCNRQETLLRNNKIKCYEGTQISPSARKLLEYLDAEIHML